MMDTWDAFVFAEEQHWFGNPISYPSGLSPKRSWLLTESNLELLQTRIESIGARECVHQWLEVSDTHQEDVDVQCMWVTHSAETGEVVSNQAAGKQRKASKPCALQPHYPVLACKYSIPPEGQSPANHTMARAACACPQCVVALNACSQARSIALQVSRDLKAVILEGEEAPEIPVGVSEAHCSLHVQSDSSCPPTPLGDAAVATPTSVHHLRTPTALVQESTCAGSMIAWYTPFSALDEGYLHTHTAPPITCSLSSRHSPCTRCPITHMRTTPHDAQTACRDTAKESGMICLQDLWTELGDSGTPDKAETSDKKGRGGVLLELKASFSALSSPVRHKRKLLHNLSACDYSPISQSRNNRFAGPPLERAVTTGHPVFLPYDPLPVPVVEARRALDVRMTSELTVASVELASLCLPSVSLTAADEPKLHQRDALSSVPSHWNATRLRSCPNIPSGLPCE